MKLLRYSNFLNIQFSITIFAYLTNSWSFVDSSNALISDSYDSFIADGIGAFEI